MSCDCIITLWTIDGTVAGEIAISASMMDFSLIAEHDNGIRPFLLKFQWVENKHVWFEVAVSLLLLLFLNFTDFQCDYTHWEHFTLSCMCHIQNHIKLNHGPMQGMAEFLFI